MDDEGGEQSADEELVLGSRSKRRDRALIGSAVLLLVAGAAVAGWRLGRNDRHPGPVASVARGPKLLVGSVVANRPADYTGPEFVATLYNAGDQPARVTNVAPSQWTASSVPVTVPPGGAVDVPMDARVDCRSTPPPTDEVTVRVVIGGRVEVLTLHLSGIPAALTDKYQRICVTPPGRPPRSTELVGVWIVDEADFFAGRMLIDLRADGTFAMDPSTTLFTGPGAKGVFTYRAGRLSLTTRGGADCGDGDRSLWRVGLLPDGRLRLQVIDFFDSVCTVETGEVWIARRVSPPGH